MALQLYPGGPPGATIPRADKGAEDHMHPGVHARTRPDHPALIMGRSGEVVTYREMDERSCRVAQALWSAGLRPGDHFAILMENQSRYYDVAWAALRLGLYLTPISTQLTAGEVAYILGDCEARAFVTSAAKAEVAEALLGEAPGLEVRLMVDGVVKGYDAFEETVARFPARPLDEEPLGEFMMYSSGTTGRPKGVKRPLSGRTAAQGSLQLIPNLRAWYGVDADTVYLSPAPLYHAAPLVFSVSVQGIGATVVAMEHFDAAECLAEIERYRVTHAQFVPTHFVRMLKLDPAERERYDVSSMQCAVHAAAPCPIPVKEQMISWWGPVLVEYYAGTEGNGVTKISSEEWLAHKGSVGRTAGGPIHICDEGGAELPTGSEGVIYFETPEGVPFAYHNDAAKTRDSIHPDHPTWSTLWDVGRLDEDGYLYLTDRRSYMIISGGVNIYPQEAENVLIMHPRVSDVAVFGVPHPEFGEEVKAVVQPAPGNVPGAELEAELLAYCRANLAHLKCPRSIDFRDQLPRLPTGKLAKNTLRDTYWQGHATRIAT
jgi:long-chain acyl-CoA synthetase